MENPDIIYDNALTLVQWIDICLDQRIYHFRDTSGQLLTTLDEVVRAILDDNLKLKENNACLSN